MNGLENLVQVVRPEASWKLPSNLSELADESPSETVWLRLYAWVIMLAAITFYFLFIRGQIQPEAILTGNVEVMGVVASCQLALHLLYWRMSNKILLTFGLRRLRTKVPDEQACPVAIEIYQQGVVTGYDEGYLWLGEGTLYYKGLQTVFRMNSPDLLPINQWPRRHRPSLDDGRLPRWLHLEGACVHLKLIDPFEDYNARRRSANFDRALAKWIADRPEGSLESKLPPLSLHPALLITRTYRREGVVASWILIAVNLLMIVTANFKPKGDDLSKLGYMVPVFGGFVLMALAIRMLYRNVHGNNVRDALAARVSSEDAAPGHLA